MPPRKKPVTPPEPVTDAEVIEPPTTEAALPAVPTDDDPLLSLAERALRHALLVSEGGELSAGDEKPLEAYLPMRDGQPLAGAELDAWVNRANDDAALRMVGRGIAYLLKQKELPANSFTGWIQDQGLKRQRVYEDMQVARMYGSLPEGVVRSIGQLPPSKQPALASLTPESIERMVNTEELDELIELPLAQFRKAMTVIKQKEKQLDHYASELAKAQEALTKREPPRRWDGGTLPLEVRRARTESAAVGLASEELLTRLDTAFSELMQGQHLSDEPSEFDDQMRAATGPLMVALESLIGRALGVRQRILDETEARHRPEPTHQPLLTQDEQAEAQEKWLLFTHQVR